MAGNDYHIYVHKGQKEGTSILSSESPSVGTNAAASSNTGLSIKGVVLLGYGKMVAQKAFSTLTQEMRANGNEATATTLSNIASSTATLAAILATKGLALIPMAVDAGITAMTNYRTVSRENLERQYLRIEQGARVTFNQGRIYG